MLLLRSFMFLVVFLQCFATTSGADYQEAAASLSEEAVRPRPTLKMVILKQPNNEWRTPTAGGSSEHETATSKEKTWKAGEKWGSPLDKLDSNQLHSLEEILTAVREDSWGYSGTFAPTDVDGRQFLNNGDGDPWRAKQQISTKGVGARKGTSMATDGGGVEMAAPAAGDSDERKPVKNENVVKESSTDERILTLTAPQDDVEKSSHEDAANGGFELNAEQSNTRRKGTINDRFRTREIVNASGDTTGKDAKIAASEEEKMFLWENEKIEPKRIGEEKSEQMIMGTRGEIKEMSERMIVEGFEDLKERMKWGKEGERVIMGTKGEIKETRERMKGEKEGERMMIGLGEMKERTKGENEGERMIVGRLEDIKERIRKLEKGISETMEGATKGEGMTGGLNGINGGMRERGWLPSWVNKARSGGEGKEMKVGNVVHIETEKERVK